MRFAFLIVVRTHVPGRIVTLTRPAAHANFTPAGAAAFWLVIHSSFAAGDTATRNAGPDLHVLRGAPDEQDEFAKQFVTAYPRGGRTRVRSRLG